MFSDNKNRIVPLIFSISLKIFSSNEILVREPFDEQSSCLICMVGKSIYTISNFLIDSSFTMSMGISIKLIIV